MSELLLLAESGATKTEWRCIQGGGVIHAFQSGGFNPNTQSKSELNQRLSSALEEGLGIMRPSQVRFYGAGLGNEPQRQQLLTSLEALFPEADVEAYHDLQAAVHSTGLQNGMLGILGTGSNACLFQHGEITHRYGGLGYLLGDEGSGTDLSRILVKTLIEGGFSSGLTQRIWEHLEMDKADLIRDIYGAPRPHAYLSNLMPKFREFVSEQPVKELITSRFLRFLDTTICRWPEHQTLPLCMVGAIAFHFRTQFEEACELRDIHLKKVDPSPIQGLVAYYLNA